MTGLHDNILVQERSLYHYRTSFYDQSSPGFSNSIYKLCNEIIDQENISTVELTKLLDKLLRNLNRVEDSAKFLNLNAILIALKHVSSLTLKSIAHHNFFIQLQEPFMHIIQRWLTTSDLNDAEAFSFRNIIKLLRTLYKNTDLDNFHPSWPFSSSFMNIIATCLTNFSKSDNRFFEDTPFESKNFASLLRMYDDYQEELYARSSSNKDALIQLIDPIVQCLTSEHYLNSFRKLKSNSLDSKQKFFLLQCPSFFITYNGMILWLIYFKTLTCDFLFRVSS